jgi:hypothetical protein
MNGHEVPVIHRIFFATIMHATVEFSGYPWGGDCRDFLITSISQLLAEDRFDFDLKKET